MFGLPDEKTAIAEEKRLYRELTEEVMTAETKGKTREQVLCAWEMAMRDGQGIYLYEPTTIRDHVALCYRWTDTWLKRQASELNAGDAREILNRVEQEGKTRKWLLQGISLYVIWPVLRFMSFDLAFLAYVVVTTVLAAASYRWFEAPARRFVENLAFRRLA